LATLAALATGGGPGLAGTAGLPDASPAKRPRLDGVLEGVVKSYHTERGWGFIASASVSRDIYFKGQSLPEHLRAADVQGQAVRFTLVHTQDGKPQARDIQVRQEA